MRKSQGYHPLQRLVSVQLQAVVARLLVKKQMIMMAAIERIILKR